MPGGDLNIVRAQNLPLTTNVSDSDSLLVWQGQNIKRVPPSLMKGKSGNPGASAYLGVNDIYILWKQGIDGAWQNLIEIDKLRGPKGEKPLFRKVDGSLQMKYEGELDSAYRSIFNREELKLKFSELTPAERDLLKLHFTDLSAEDIRLLQKPATDAAAEANKATESANVAAQNAQEAADNVQDGKTPVLQTGTTQTGVTGSNASIELVKIGDDATGNPIYETRASIPQGATGRPGKDFQILGYYDTIAELRAAVTTPEPGEAYGIGTAAPYPIYIWDGVSQDWLNNGAIQGPAGMSGKSVRVNRETGYWQEFNDATQTWSDTEYIAQYIAATADKDGLLSKEGKVKLDGIAEGANKYVHSTFTAKASGLYKVTVNEEGHVSGATPVEKKDITDLGIPESNTDTTYEVATPEQDGLMSKEDKQKLDEIKGGDIEVSKENIERVLTGNISTHTHDRVMGLVFPPTDVWDGTTVSTALSGSGTKDDPWLIQSCADWLYLIQNGKIYSGTDQNTMKYIKLVKCLDFDHKEFVMPAPSETNICMFNDIDGNGCSFKNVYFRNTFSVACALAYSMIHDIGVDSGRFVFDVSSKTEMEYFSVFGSASMYSGTNGTYNCYCKASFETEGILSGNFTILLYGSITSFTGSYYGRNTFVNRCDVASHSLCLLYAPCTCTGENIVIRYYDASTTVMPPEDMATLPSSGFYPIYGGTESEMPSTVIAFYNSDTIPGIVSVGGGLAIDIAKTTAEMKSPEFLALINGDTDAFVSDTDNLNDGYPVFKPRKIEGVLFDGYVPASLYENEKIIPLKLLSTEIDTKPSERIKRHIEEVGGMDYIVNCIKKGFPVNLCYLEGSAYVGMPAIVCAADSTSEYKAISLGFYFFYDLNAHYIKLIYMKSTGKYSCATDKGGSADICNLTITGGTTGVMLDDKLTKSGIIRMSDVEIFKLGKPSGVSMQFKTADNKIYTDDFIYVRSQGGDSSITVSKLGNGTYEVSTDMEKITVPST